jgi:hypothetical protein
MQHLSQAERSEFVFFTICREYDLNKRANGGNYGLFARLCQLFYFVNKVSWS